MASSSSSCPTVDSLDMASLRARYAAAELSPVDVVRQVYAAISAYADKAVWIYLVPEAEAVARAQELEQQRAKGFAADGGLPALYGMPFSVKDSMDVAGLATTLACPSFAYTATATAPVVERALQAGGILIGKTNLDQFATGLAGVRSPYGVPRCVFDAAYISGGSSSGSAVSVAAGLVAFSICTDTGGSTRVPAAFNGLVGLKPTLGTVSTRGLVPACRNIDCVCVLARTLDDAAAVWAAVAAFDEDDVFSRRQLPSWPAWPSTTVRFGIPDADALAPLSPAYAALFRATVAALPQLKMTTSSGHSGCVQADVDYAPFAQANQMLYDASIVAQRLLAFEPYTQEHGLQKLHPAIRETFAAAAASNFSATRAYADIFALAGFRRQAEAQFRRVDVLVVPSTVDQYTVAELDEQPMVRNKAMGRFTNFVNLLDLCAVSVPVGWWRNKNGNDLSFAVTVVGQAGKDREVMEFAKMLMAMPRLRFDSAV